MRVNRQHFDRFSIFAGASISALLPFFLLSFMFHLLPPISGDTAVTPLPRPVRPPPGPQKLLLLPKMTKKN